MQTVVSCEKPVFEDKALQKDWEWYKANFAELKKRYNCWVAIKNQAIVCTGDTWLDCAVAAMPILGDENCLTQPCFGNYPYYRQRKCFF
jgi:hypothetical protein